MCDNEPTEQEIEQSLNQFGDPTTSVPEPSHRTDKVVVWLSNPQVMLEDLTEALNNLLRNCRFRYFDEVVIELDPGKFKNANLLDIWISMVFLEMRELVMIRNTIQPTPFSLDIIEDVERLSNTHFLAFHADEPVPKKDNDRLCAAISHYKFQLQVLADWIESKAIFLGEKKPPRKHNKADISDIQKAVLAVTQSGQKPNKTNVGQHIRKVLKKTISTNECHIQIKQLEREAKNPVRIYSDRTAD
jgi:hypothetical protein